MNTPVTPAMREWAERVRPGARVTGGTVRPLAGGAVADQVDQVTLHLADGRGHLELVRKQAPAHEIAGLRAAQAARADTAAIPELVAWGSDWLVTPLASGSPLAWGDQVPASLFDALAALHARYQGAADLPATIPRVTPAWWQSLCRDWAGPQLREHAERHPRKPPPAPWRSSAVPPTFPAPPPYLSAGLISRWFLSTVCRRFPVSCKSRPAAGAAGPGSHHLEHPSLSWQAGPARCGMGGAFLW